MGHSNLSQLGALTEGRVGILATCIAFVGATRQLRSGNRASFNRFLRFRVIAQGLTIAACVGGSYYYGREERAAQMDATKDAVSSAQNIRS